MSNPEKKLHTPAFIDYDDECNEPVEQWTPTRIKHYWYQLFVKIHKGGGLLWTIKETSLLARMMKEFSTEDIVGMMEFWVKSKSPMVAGNFSVFYNSRLQTFEAIKGYEWS